MQIMQLLQAVYAALLGIVQGLAEFLPISSSGHLLLAQNLLELIGYRAGSVAAQKIFSVTLHAGTLVAVFVVFWDDWMRMIRHPIKSRTLHCLIIATLPAVLTQLLAGDYVDSFFSGWFLGVSFIISGVLLSITELVCKKRPRHEKEDRRVHPWQALVMGVLQGTIGLLPGVSRSGSTIFGGIATGLTRRTAAKFSFLMSAPAILGALVVEGKDILEMPNLSFNVTNLAVGVLAAGFSGYFAIKYMLRLISRISLNRFAIYLFVLGAAVVVMQILGVAGLPAFKLPAIG